MKLQNCKVSLAKIKFFAKDFWLQNCYSAFRLNDHPFCSHISAVKAGWPFIRVNLIENPSFVIVKSGQLSRMTV